MSQYYNNCTRAAGNTDGPPVENPWAARKECCVQIVGWYFKLGPSVLLRIIEDFFVVPQTGQHFLIS